MGIIILNSRNENINRLLIFKQYIEICDYEKLDKFLDCIKDFDNMYFYYLAACKYKNFKLLRMLYDKGFDINICSITDKSLLYELASKEKFNDVSKWLIRNGLNIINSLNIFNPIFPCITAINIELFVYLLDHIDLFTKDEYGNSILVNLIKINKLNMIKYFCGKMEQISNNTALLQYLNESNNRINIIKSNNLNIIKYLITKGFILYNESIIYCNYKRYKLIYLNKNIKLLKNILFIENYNITYIDFVLYLKNICNCWNCTHNVFFRQIYNINYPIKYKLKACYLCHHNNYTHDYDTIIFFCRQIHKTESAIKIQKWIKKKINLSFSEYEFNIVKIQRWWRGILYSNLKDTCAICLREHNNFNIILSCKHIFHNICIMNWRKYKNNCPICREKIHIKPKFIGNRINKVN